MVGIAILGITRVMGSFSIKSFLSFWLELLLFCTKNILSSAGEIISHRPLTHEYVVYYVL